MIKFLKIKKTKKVRKNGSKMTQLYYIEKEGKRGKVNVEQFIRTGEPILVCGRAASGKTRWLKRLVPNAEQIWAKITAPVIFLDTNDTIAEWRDQEQIIKWWRQNNESFDQQFSSLTLVFSAFEKKKFKDPEERERLKQNFADKFDLLEGVPFVQQMAEKDKKKFQKFINKKSSIADLLKGTKTDGFDPLKIFKSQDSSPAEWNKLPNHRKNKAMLDYVSQNWTVVFIDNIDRLSGKKLDFVKEILKELKSKIWVCTATAENRINPSLRNFITKSKPQTFTLNSPVSYDATNALTAILCVVLTFIGWWQVAAALGGMRMLGRGMFSTKQQ